MKIYAIQVSAIQELTFEKKENFLTALENTIKRLESEYEQGIESKIIVSIKNS